jgi:hypothetical protein
VQLVVADLARRFGGVGLFVVLNHRGRPQQGIKKQHLGARRILQVRRVIAGELGLARVRHDHLEVAAADRTLEVQVEHWQLFIGVDAKQQYHIVHRVRPVLRLHDLRHGRQTGVDGAHVTTVAVVDVVRAHQLAHKALQQVVAFIGQFGAADSTDGVGTVLAFDALQLLGHQAQRFLPRRGLQLAVLAHERHG